MTNVLTKVFLFSVMGAGVLPAAASATSWYWDGLNGSAAGSGSASSPFLYLYQARKVAQPGDTIYVVPSMVYPKIGMNIGGTANAPVTIAGSDPLNPTRVSGGGLDVGILIYANYVTVSNFDVTAPGGPYAGILIQKNYHHVTIANNVVHGAGGNGIYAGQDDYVTISGNVVYGNANNTTKGFDSGISIKGSIDVDTNIGIKMVVNGNIVYNNTNIPNCSTPECFATAIDTDGSGIILDTNNGAGLNQPPYGGAFLISNNVSYSNGGRGLYVYLSDNATLTGNTTWSNNQDPYQGLWHPGEAMVVQSGNTSIYNNILYSDGAISPIPSGGTPNYHTSISIEKCTDMVGPVIAKYNMVYNAAKNTSYSTFLQNNTNPVSVNSNPYAGPKFQSITNHDFRLQSISTALYAADPATSVATDILGVSRAPLPSMGAYQLPAS